MDDGFEFKHLLWVVAAGLAVRFLWSRSAYAEGNRDQLLQAISGGGGDSRPWLHVERYQPGVRGVARTLQAMRALARRASGDPSIRAAAHRIAGDCAGHDFGCEVDAVFSFTRDRITYRRDPAGYEWVQGPRETLRLGFGDCDDKSTLLAALLSALGHRARFVVIGKHRGTYTHVFVEVWGGDQWIALDPTNERAPVGWQARARARAVYPIFG